MLAQVVGVPSVPLGELGSGVAGSTLLCLLLLAASLVVLRVVAGRSGGRGRPSGPLQVVARLELRAGQSLYLIRAADRCLLVGGTSSGLNLLAELDPSEVAARSAIADSGAHDLLQRLRAHFPGPGPGPGRAAHAAHLDRPRPDATLADDDQAAAHGHPQLSISGQHRLEPAVNTGSPAAAPGRRDAVKGS